MDIDITADPGMIVLSGYATGSQYPPAVINPALNQTFDCEVIDAIPEIVITAHGTWQNRGIVAEPGVITLTALGDTSVAGITIISTPGIITITPITSEINLSLAESLAGAYGDYWIRWSDIGHLDFTVDRSNVAGKCKPDWKGIVYDIKKLGNKVIIYGENGISIFNPAGNAYGVDTINRLGLKNRQAVTGTDDQHFFIDRKGRLWKLEKELELIDYSEFFSSMSALVMSYDIKNELIYICDGTSGYIYSIRSQSLGSGPVNLTGIGNQDSLLYSVAPAEIVTPIFEICTDIYDMGTRKFKTIKSIEVGTNLTESMQASVDYRVSNKLAFSNIGWHPVTIEGISTMYCYGLEFRFRLRIQTYEYFELDYLKINGLIHNYSYTEHSLRSDYERRRAL